MACIIPENVREKWKTQAQLAGMNYVTVVGQHVYDLQGLIDVLKQQLEQTTNALKNLPDNSPDYQQTEQKIANLKAKLDHTEQQLAAYQAEAAAEQKQGGTEMTPTK